jgi:leader peptidase (prepilin peptidase) / N-methyltransferase
MASVGVLVFVGGCVLGSLITVLAHRLPREEPWIAGRSRCPSCGAQIGARDNIPVLSWLLLRGRCRNCGKPISIRYPLAELGLGALWVGTYLTLGDDDVAQLALGLTLCAVLVAITLTDLDLRLIPNKILLAGALVAVAVVAATDPEDLAERAIAAAAAGGVLFLVALAYPRGMGMGDVKLVAMMGLYLGRAIAPAVLIGFAAGALVGAAMIARHGAGARKQAIPFGPFLALGGVVGLWFGDEIVDWYLDELFPSD